MVQRPRRTSTGLRFSGLTRAASRPGARSGPVRPGPRRDRPGQIRRSARLRSSPRPRSPRCRQSRPGAPPKGGPSTPQAKAPWAPPPCKAKNRGGLPRADPRKGRRVRVIRGHKLIPPSNRCQTTANEDGYLWRPRGQAAPRPARTIPLGQEVANLGGKGPPRRGRTALVHLSKPPLKGLTRRSCLRHFHQLPRLDVVSTGVRAESFAAEKPGELRLGDRPHTSSRGLASLSQGPLPRRCAAPAAPTAVPAD